MCLVLRLAEALLLLYQAALAHQAALARDRRGRRQKAFVPVHLHELVANGATDRVTAHRRQMLDHIGVGVRRLEEERIVFILFRLCSPLALPSTLRLLLSLLLLSDSRRKAARLLAESLVARCLVRRPLLPAHVIAHRVGPCWRPVCRRAATVAERGRACSCDWILHHAEVEGRRNRLNVLKRA